MQTCNDTPPWYEYEGCQKHNEMYHIHGNNTNTTCLDENRFYRTCKADGPNPYYGAVSFDNIALAFIFIFQVRIGIEKLKERILQTMLNKISERQKDYSN